MRDECEDAFFIIPIRKKTFKLKLSSVQFKTEQCYVFKKYLLCSFFDSDK